MKKINDFQLIKHLYVNLRMYVSCLNKALEPLKNGTSSNNLQLIKNSNVVFRKNITFFSTMLNLLESQFHGTIEIPTSENNLFLEVDTTEVNKLNFEELVWLIVSTSGILRSKLQYMEENGGLVDDADESENLFIQIWFMVSIPQIKSMERLASLLSERFVIVKNNE